jgi:ferric-dicitrate binding protein FerR (iron transport regulator)
MSNEKAEELIRKYLEGTATPEEEALLDSWYMMAAQEQEQMAGSPEYQKIKDEILGSLRAEQGEQPKIRRPVRLFPRAAAAAAVLIILSVGGFLLFHKKPAPEVVRNESLQHDILPADAKATLTLLDGRTVDLDSTGGATLPRQGNSTIRSGNGQLIYSVDQHPAQAPRLAYNTLTTAPGEYYSVVLPDGTRVWLNAASSITYPTAFIGNERLVKITGEVYFEIVHDPRQPFQIAVKDQTIEDIGTHLNVSAYDDEPVITTTMVEGSVKVKKSSAMDILTEGHQATTRPGENSFQIKQVDAEAAIAWKNGYFSFDRADIKTVMREMARWYDLQVVYQGEIPKRTFKGKVYRNIRASEALKILSYFDAHFQIEGRKITVSS